MQDVEKVTKLLKEETTKETDVQTLSGSLSVEDKPTVAKLNPAIIVPAPLKRKRFSNEDESNNFFSSIYCNTTIYRTFTSVSQAI